MSTAASESPDVVLIGAGIMSATLGTVLKELRSARDFAREEWPPSGAVRLMS
jgi:Malate:quinone oxidoreductase (Mqo)